MNRSLHEAAQRFWHLVGFDEPFPRNLEAVIALAVPLTIVRLPKLSPRTVSDWLASAGVQWPSQTRERRLRGFLVAYRGHGFVFVDGSLAPDEFRLTLAHELAHFLSHYLWPREQALRRLGSGIEPVLDGDRFPTSAEKLSGVLQGVEIGICRHLLERVDGVPSARVTSLEAEADLLAFELLAPIKSVVASSDPGAERRNALINQFGFPPWAAEAWAGWLDARSAKNRFIQGLRGAAKNR